VETGLGGGSSVGEVGPHGRLGRLGSDCGRVGAVAVLTRDEALVIIRRAYGPEVADALAERLPERIDPENDADAEFLGSLGVTRDGLANALGGEL
jgi:hypothetical protein